MDGDKKKKVMPTLNEQAIMEMMVGGVRKEGFDITDEEKVAIFSTHKQTDEKQQNESENVDKATYEDIFLRDVRGTARHGKSVYIDPDHHKKLSRIVQVIGDDNITIYAYLYNLLNHHFQEFEQEITISFNEKNKPLF